VFASAVLSILALIFFAAAVGKALTLEEFFDVLEASQLVKGQLIPSIAVTLIALELALAVLLCIPRSRALALQGAFVLSLLFLGYSIWRLINHIGVPCSCFGPLFKHSPVSSLVLAGLMTVASYWLLRRFQARGGSFQQTSTMRFS